MRTASDSPQGAAQTTVTIQPTIRKVGEARGSGLGAIRCVVEHDVAWLPANKRLDRRQDRPSRVILALMNAAASSSSLTASKHSENRAIILRHATCTADLELKRPSGRSPEYPRC
jgi:hypothetical protein